MTQMSYGKKRNQVGVTIVCGILAIGLLTTTGWIGVKSQEKSKTLKEIQTETDTLEASKVQLEEQIKEITGQSEQLVTQIEELKLEVEKLKAQGYDIAPETDEVDKKYAYLTFDDGPSQNTIKILDFLKVNNIQATFFVLGKEGYDDVYKRIVDEGHTIALHSDTHDYAEIYKNVDTFMADQKALSDQIEELTGVVPMVTRFPGGSNNQVSHRYGGSDIMDQIIPVMEEAGYVYFDWNVDSQDASKGVQDKSVIVNSVLTQAKYQESAVILMHDAPAKTTTVEALPEIVEGLKTQGFVFRPLTTDTEQVAFK